MLEDHLVKQCLIFGHGSGLFNEQGGEACHALFNRDLPRTRMLHIYYYKIRCVYVCVRE